MNKALDTYECEGQMSISDFLKEKDPETAKKIEKKPNCKPLKMFMSLSAYYTKCPYCGAENSEEPIGIRNHYRFRCLKCGAQMVGVAEIKSKEYREVEALGLNGCVTKDDQGRWAEVHYDGKGNRYLTYGSQEGEKN